MLANALPYAPPGVHLAVVDPGVGLAAARAWRCGSPTEDRVLVGPDNGLLLAGVERLGGAVEAVDVSLSPFRLEPVSATFHGRDLFAPVAAHLALGAPLAEAGEEIDRGLADRRSSASEPAIERGPRRRPRGLGRPLRQRGARPRRPRTSPQTGLRLGSRARGARRGGQSARRRLRAAPSPTSAPGELILYEDSYRSLALAVNRGSAAERLRPRRRATRSLLLPERGDDRPSAARAATSRHRLDQRRAPASWRAAGAPSGTVVTADEQTAGRGRRGRAWAAPRRQGAAVLGDPAPAGARARPAAAGGAARGLRGGRVAGAASSAAVKWPNDVWIDERKVAGVLIEARPPDWAVIGIGLNLAIEPDEFPRRPALAGDLGRPRGRPPRRRWRRSTSRLGPWVDAPAERVLAEFAERDALRGRRDPLGGRRRRRRAGHRRAEGIDDSGNLLVATDDGERLSLGAGEVQLALAER